MGNDNQNDDLVIFADSMDCHDDYNDGYEIVNANYVISRWFQNHTSKYFQLHAYFLFN